MAGVSPCALFESSGGIQGLFLPDVHINILEAHEPKIHSVEGYVQSPHVTLWLPQCLDKYASIG